MTRRPSILLPANSSGPNGSGDGPELEVDETLPLAPPKMWTRGFFIVCGVVTGILVLLLREMTTFLDMSLPTVAWLIPVGVLAAIVGVRYLLKPSSPRTIRFRADDVVLPKSRNSRRSYEVPYEEIRAAVPLVSRGEPALVVEGPRKTHVFVASDFPNPRDWRVLLSQITDRVARRPGGREQLEEMRQMADLSQETSSVKPRFTKYLLGLIAAIFGAQFFLAPDVDVLELLYFGANSDVMVLGEGQWWRLVTANLLHGNAIHFGVNAFALYFLGTYCERLFGEGRAIVLTLGTALAGAAASMVGTGAMFAVGISTALFGLLGAYFALHLRHGRQLPPPYRQSWLWWGVILGLNGALSIGVPMIDAWGHFGGFVAGVALGWLMTTGRETFSPRPVSGIWTNLSAAVLIALFAASSVIGLGYALGDHPEDEVTFGEALVERADQQEPAMLAQVAYQWSRHSPRPDAIDPVLMDLSRAAHDRADDIFPSWRAASSMIRLAEQRGDPFDAEWMKEGVRRFEQTATSYEEPGARQALARVLVEFVDESGALYVADAPWEGARWVGDRVGLTPEATVDEPRRVYLLVLEPGDDRRVAKRMLDRCLPAGTGDEARPVDRELPGDREFEIGMVAPADDCPEGSSERWRATEMTEPPEP